MGDWLGERGVMASADSLHAIPNRHGRINMSVLLTADDGNAAADGRLPGGDIFAQPGHGRRRGGSRGLSSAAATATATASASPMSAMAGFAGGQASVQSWTDGGSGPTGTARIKSSASTGQAPLGSTSVLADWTAPLPSATASATESSTTDGPRRGGASSAPALLPGSDSAAPADVSTVLEGIHRIRERINQTKRTHAAVAERNRLQGVSTASSRAASQRLSKSSRSKRQRPQQKQQQRQAQEHATQSAFDPDDPGEGEHGSSAFDMLIWLEDELEREQQLKQQTQEMTHLYADVEDSTTRMEIVLRQLDTPQVSTNMVDYQHSHLVHSHHSGHHRAVFQKLPQGLGIGSERAVPAHAASTKLGSATSPSPPPSAVAATREHTRATQVARAGHGVQFNDEREARLRKQALASLKHLSQQFQLDQRVHALQGINDWHSDAAGKAISVSAEDMKASSAGSQPRRERTRQSHADSDSSSDSSSDDSSQSNEDDDDDDASMLQPDNVVVSADGFSGGDFFELGSETAAPSGSAVLDDNDASAPSAADSPADAVSAAQEGAASSTLSEAQSASPVPDFATTFAADCRERVQLLGKEMEDQLSHHENELERYVRVQSAVVAKESEQEMERRADELKDLDSQIRELRYQRNLLSKSVNSLREHVDTDEVFQHLQKRHAAKTRQMHRIIEHQHHRYLALVARYHQTQDDLEELQDEVSDLQRMRDATKNALDAVSVGNADGSTGGNGGKSGRQPGDGTPSSDGATAASSRSSSRTSSRAAQNRDVRAMSVAERDKERVKAGSKMSSASHKDGEDDDNNDDEIPPNELDIPDATEVELRHRAISDKLVMHDQWHLERLEEETKGIQQRADVVADHLEDIESENKVLMRRLRQAGRAHQSGYEMTAINEQLAKVRQLVDTLDEWDAECSFLGNCVAELEAARTTKSIPRTLIEPLVDRSAAGRAQGGASLADDLVENVMDLKLLEDKLKELKYKAMSKFGAQDFRIPNMSNQEKKEAREEGAMLQVLQLLPFRHRKETERALRIMLMNGTLVNEDVVAMLETHAFRQVLALTAKLDIELPEGLTERLENESSISSEDKQTVLQLATKVTPKFCLEKGIKSGDVPRLRDVVQQQIFLLAIKSLLRLSDKVVLKSSLAQAAFQSFSSKGQTEQKAIEDGQKKKADDAVAVEAALEEAKKRNIGVTQRRMSALLEYAKKAAEDSKGEAAPSPVAAANATSSPGTANSPSARPGGNNNGEGGSQDGTLSTVAGSTTSGTDATQAAQEAAGKQQAAGSATDEVATEEEAHAFVEQVFKLAAVEDTLQNTTADDNDAQSADTSSSANSKASAATEATAEGTKAPAAPAAVTAATKQKKTSALTKERRATCADLAQNLRASLTQEHTNETGGSVVVTDAGQDSTAASSSAQASFDSGAEQQDLEHQLEQQWAEVQDSLPDHEEMQRNAVAAMRKLRGGTKAAMLALKLRRKQKQRQASKKQMEEDNDEEEDDDMVDDVWKDEAARMKKAGGDATQLANDAEVVGFHDAEDFVKCCIALDQWMELGDRSLSIQHGPLLEAGAQLLQQTRALVAPWTDRIRAAHEKTVREKEPHEHSIATAAAAAAAADKGSEEKQKRPTPQLLSCKLTQEELDGLVATALKQLKEIRSVLSEASAAAEKQQAVASHVQNKHFDALVREAMTTAKARALPQEDQREYIQRAIESIQRNLPESVRGELRLLVSQARLTAFEQTCLERGWNTHRPRNISEDTPENRAALAAHVLKVQAKVDERWAVAGRMHARHMCNPRLREMTHRVHNWEATIETLRAKFDKQLGAVMPSAHSIFKKMYAMEEKLSALRTAALTNEVRTRAVHAKHQPCETLYLSERQRKVSARRVNMLKRRSRAILRKLGKARGIWTRLRADYPMAFASARTQKAQEERRQTEAAESPLRTSGSPVRDGSAEPATLKTYDMLYRLQQHDSMEEQEHQARDREACRKRSPVARRRGGVGVGGGDSHGGSTYMETGLFGSTQPPGHGWGTGPTVGTGDRNAHGSNWKDQRTRKKAEEATVSRAAADLLSAVTMPITDRREAAVTTGDENALEETQGKEEWAVWRGSPNRQDGTPQVIAVEVVSRYGVRYPALGGSDEEGSPGSGGGGKGAHTLAAVGATKGGVREELERTRRLLELGGEHSPSPPTQLLSNESKMPSVPPPKPAPPSLFAASVGGQIPAQPSAVAVGVPQHVPKQQLGAFGRQFHQPKFPSAHSPLHNPPKTPGSGKGSSARRGDRPHGSPRTALASGGNSPGVFQSHMRASRPSALSPSQRHAKPHRRHVRSRDGQRSVRHGLSRNGVSPPLDELGQGSRVASRTHE